MPPPGRPKSIHHACVLIKQRHIRVRKQVQHNASVWNKYMLPVYKPLPPLCSLLFGLSPHDSLQVVNVPSFNVRLDSQKHIDFSLM